ncbi:MAG: hypothetical protein RIT27_1262 [Pseudomonadota bacterium]|jgi:rhodanese-related sulfurtransferase
MQKYGRWFVMGWICWAVSAVAEVKNIDNNMLQTLIKQGVPIVDIRTPEEWKATGIVEGSHLLTFFDKNGRYDAANWTQSLEKITQKDQPVILICRTGNRTTNVAHFLDKKMGYQMVYNVERGIVGWLQKGNPVVKAP